MSSRPALLLLPITVILEQALDSWMLQKWPSLSPSHRLRSLPVTPVTGSLSSSSAHSSFLLALAACLNPNPAQDGFPSRWSAADRRSLANNA